MKKTVKKTMPKKSNKIHDASSEFDNLYISMNDVTNKRKSILSSIKDSLIMQEESEKIAFLRKEKTSVLNEIKKDLTALNSDYQKLKKALPNVKNVISYTERELNELESHIDSLKKNIDSDNSEIMSEEVMIENLNDGNKFDSKPEPVKTPKAHSKKKKVESVKPLSKSERIKNNLKVIEAKLNNL